MITSKYFKDSEFKKCSPACSLQYMEQSTMDMLDKAREIAGIPFVLNSAYRTPVWDKSRGRSGTGAHTLGCAVDIRCRTLDNRYKIVAALIQAGFRRIGIAEEYIHADNSSKHQSGIIWMY